MSNTERQLSVLNVGSATIVVRINDFVGNSTGKFTLDDQKSIDEMRSFLDFREIELRNNKSLEEINKCQ